MSEQPAHETADRVVAFGPFRLLLGQRLLLEGDAPARLGSRACDILLALLERPGQVVTKQELLTRVWPGTFVEEASLRVHVAALRRALGDGSAGRRFILNVPGRSEEAEKCFVDSLDLALRQGTIAWQLRAATSLARLHLQARNSTKARNALAPVYAGFREGFDTADLKEAKELLDLVTAGARVGKRATRRS